MNRTDLNCPLDITNKFYTSPPLRRFFYPLAVLNCVIDGCLPITSVGGSALLIAAVIKFPQLRDVPSNFLLASQAFCDLLIGLLVQPLLTARHVSFLLGKCLLISQSNFFKGFASYWLHALLFSSCLNICLITIDRYICIAHSLRYQTLVTDEGVIKAITASWLFSLAFAIIQALPFLPETTIVKTTVRVFSVIPPLLLVFTTFFCYTKMAKIARRHKRQIRAQMNVIQGPTEQDFQSTKTTLLMVGVIFLCYVPAVIVVLGLYANNNLALLEAIKPFVATLAILNSSINPLVYYVRSRKIRRYVWKVLKCE
ncbi:hypothetical protein OS493_004926 [Desmophyllum pertusum]|uniref:G-protein coupled receptors family 1 profile domain-containing protein n=1 Tax=Desmophyllum pertusum TaxID=174260 RepID=A0A9W9Z6A7_9CNID|nr:hypothetical protein OS493_004926 [Desmophyllum pertusum]